MQTSEPMKAEFKCFEIGEYDWVRINKWNDEKKIVKTETERYTQIDI